jgi:hypothetical protein
MEYKLAKPNEQALSEPQRQCIEQLISGKTKKGAAEVVGVAQNTVIRWFRDAEFVAALNRRRLEVQEENTERLRAMTQKALDVLEAALEDANPYVRLRAAMQVLQAAKLTELPSPSRLTYPEEVAADWFRETETKENLLKIQILLQELQEYDKAHPELRPWFLAAGVDRG